ncbi:proteasome activator pa28 [Powellomyces hirtus]|nr:proteasome activator pa28 [Powellomyces hirtus]
MKEIAALKRSVQAYMDTSRKEGEEIVRIEFPRKLQHLQSLIQEKLPPSDASHIRDLNTSSLKIPVSNSPDSKKRRHLEPVDENSGATPAKHGPEADEHVRRIPVNSAATHLLAILKPEVIHMAELCGKVKTWLQLKRSGLCKSRILESAIYDALVSELIVAEDAAMGILRSLRDYHVERATLCTKLIAHPNVNDYVEAINELDEMECLHLRKTLGDLALNYALLYNRMHQNLGEVGAL